jgi:hypothetical protein
MIVQSNGGLKLYPRDSTFNHEEHKVHKERQEEQEKEKQENLLLSVFIRVHLWWIEISQYSAKSSAAGTTLDFPLSLL